MGRLAGWRRWDPLTAAGPSETGREPDPEPDPEQGPEREAPVRAERGRRRCGLWEGLAHPRGEGRGPWEAGAGSAAFSEERSAGRRAGL